MRRITVIGLFCSFALLAMAQLGSIQLDVKPTNKKKDLAAGFGNAAAYQQSRGLCITLRNGSPQMISGLVVRWGVVKMNYSTHSRMMAYGADETVDLKPMETKVIETAMVEAQGQRWNYLAPQGEKIVGHGVMLMQGDKVIAEQMMPPTVKPAFEKGVRPVDSDGNDNTGSESGSHPKKAVKNH